MIENVYYFELIKKQERQHMESYKKKRIPEHEYISKMDNSINNKKKRRLKK